MNLIYEGNDEDDSSNENENTSFYPFHHWLKYKKEKRPADFN